MRADVASLSDAFASLRKMKERIPSTKDAIGHLHDLSADLQVATCFRDLFPEQFAKHLRGKETPRPSHISKNAPPFEVAYYHFFDLVEQNYFPTSDSADFEAREYGIPIVGYLSVDWWNDDVFDYPSALRLAVALLESHPSGGGEELWESLGLDREPRVGSPQAVDYDELERLCAASRHVPARDFLCALRTVDKSTGNTWADISSESNLPQIPWTRDEVELLAREWKEAEAMVEKVDALSRWLDEDLPRRTRMVLRLWNRAVSLAAAVRREARLVEVLR